MKMRLTGTEEEIETYIEDLKMYYDIIFVSEFYPNTRKVKESKEGRCYAEIRLNYIDEHGKLRYI